MITNKDIVKEIFEKIGYTPSEREVEIVVYRQGSVMPIVRDL